MLKIRYLLKSFKNIDSELIKSDIQINNRREEILKNIDQNNCQIF